MDDAGRPHGHRRRLARPAVRGQGRPGDDELRAASRLVLLLPLLPAADLQVARLGDPGDGRDPDDHHGADARAAIHGHATRATAVPPAGRGRDHDPDGDRDGRAHLQGGNSEGGARERDARRGAGVGEEGEPAGERGSRREAVRPVGLPDLPYVSRHRLVQPRCAEPERGGQEGPRNRLPDPPLEGSSVGHPWVVDAVLRLARRGQHPEDRDLPRSFEGRAVVQAARRHRRIGGLAQRRLPASVGCACASFSA